MCLVAVSVLEDVTLPVRMFTFKSLVQSEDIEFPATAEAPSTLCYHHKELPPVLNVFSAREKALKKQIMNTLSSFFLVLHIGFNSKKYAVSLKFPSRNLSNEQTEWLFFR